MYRKEFDRPNKLLWETIAIAAETDYMLIESRVIDFLLNYFYKNHFF